MTLRQKQSRFAFMVGKLILYAYDRGFELTLGDAYAVSGHKTNSNHYIRLAIDLNLFKDGKFITDGTGHDVLHDYWDDMGGAPRILKDMNHYSLEHNGAW